MNLQPARSSRCFRFNYLIDSINKNSLNSHPLDNSFYLDEGLDRLSFLLRTKQINIDVYRDTATGYQKWKLFIYVVLKCSVERKIKKSKALKFFATRTLSFFTLALTHAWIDRLRMCSPYTQTLQNNQQQLTWTMTTSACIRERLIAKLTRYAASPH